MSDYIKREDAIFIALQQPLYSVVSQIKQLDGIDIVRCKECKWYRAYADQHGCWERCDRTMMNANSDGFCSYGERNE